MPYPRKIKPWRGHPASNHVHGIRGRVNQLNPDPAKGEISIGSVGAAGSVPIGTVPGGTFFVGITQRVEVAFTGTAPTLLIGTTPGGGEISAAAAITAQGPTERTIVTTYVMPTTDTVIYLSTGGTPTANVGLVDVLVQFYVNKD